MPPSDLHDRRDAPLTGPLRLSRQIHHVGTLCAPAIGARGHRSSDSSTLSTRPSSTMQPNPLRLLGCGNPAARLPGGGTRVRPAPGAALRGEPPGQKPRYVRVGQAQGRDLHRRKPADLGVLRIEDDLTAPFVHDEDRTAEDAPVARVVVEADVERLREASPRSRAPRAARAPERGRIAPRPARACRRRGPRARP